MDSALAAESFRTLYPNHGIDVLYIDGAHEFEAFSSDIALWTPLLSSGGTLLCHDYLWCSDIIRIVFERIILPGHFEKFGTVDYTFFAKKKNTAPQKGDV